MAEFGTLARRLPQDPVPRAPAAYPFFRRSPNVEDRRNQELTPAEEARLLLQLLDPTFKPNGANVPPPVQQPLAGPLSVDAGLLDVQPSHERWLAERIGATPSSITVSNR